jgi:chemotaxis response regulator CheB
MQSGRIGIAGGGFRNTPTSESHSEIAVVAEAKDFTSAVRLAEQLRPDVILLDSRMKDSHGLDALAAGPKLISTGATILAIFFSVDDDVRALAKQIGAAKLPAS